MVTSEAVPEELRILFLFLGAVILEPDWDIREIERLPKVLEESGEDSEK